MEIKVTDRKETQELIASIRFIAENIQPSVLLQHKREIAIMKEDVFDSLLSTMIPLVPRGGVVCWPETGDETHFVYDYDKTPAHVSIAWKNYCDGRGIDYRDLVLALSVDLTKDEWSCWKNLINQAKRVL